MNKTEKLYKRLCLGLSGIISPSKRNKTIYPMLRFAGFRGEYDFYLGGKILLALLTALIGFLLPWTLPVLRFGLPLFLWPGIGFLLAAAFFLLVAISFYLYIYYRIDARVKMVESILPDFLLLVASNVRAGMTPFAAFRASARNEFGPLAEEIKLATSESLGVESFTEALSKLSQRIASDSLREIVSFFAQSLRSGGKIARLLETTANDLRQTQALKKELLSSTKMYVMFVVFVVVIATPVLLSVSVQFLDMIESIQSESHAAPIEGAQLGFLASKPGFNSAFMQTVSYALLLGNSFLASIFIGVIGGGKGKNGLKYAPIILVVSIIVFFASRTAFSGMLST